MELNAFTPKLLLSRVFPQPCPLRRSGHAALPPPPALLISPLQWPPSPDSKWVPSRPLPIMVAIINIVNINTMKKVRCAVSTVWPLAASLGS